MLKKQYVIKQTSFCLKALMICLSVICSVYANAAPVQILSTSPLAAAVNVALDSEIVLTFNQEINPTQIKILTSYYPSSTSSTPSYVNGKISYANKVLRFKPSDNLAGNMKYTVDFKNMVSTVGGTTLPQYIFQFTTKPNAAPVAQSQTLNTPKSTPISFKLTATDAENDVMYFIPSTNFRYGVLSGTSPNYTYTPSASFTGQDSFTFYARDVVRNVSNTATIAINVGSSSSTPPPPSTTVTNTAPVASSQSVSVVTALSSAIRLMATDRENNALTYTVTRAPLRGTLTGTPPNLSYVSQAGYVGSDSFTFTAKDAALTSNTSTVSINVLAIERSVPQAFVLSVAKTSGGNVSGGGINCGALCSAKLNTNTAVQLTTTAESGYVFDHWEGDCAGYNGCSLTMNAAKTVKAVFTSTNSNDVCQGLVTDKNPRAIVPVAQPAVKGSYIDPAFGTRIVRVTKAPLGSAIKPVYSTTQTWNADESMMLLYQVGGTFHLYNGKTYDPIRVLSDVRPANIEGLFWHTSRPEILYYLDATTKKAVEYNVLTRVKTDIADMAPVCNSGITGGEDIMFTSWDSNTIGFRCMSSAGMIGSFIDIAKRSVGSTLNLASAGYTNFYAPQPSASGKYFYLGGNVLSRNLTFVSKLDLGNFAEHSSLGQDHLGRDSYNIVSFDVGPRGCDIGSMVNYTLETGECRVLVGPKTGYPYTPSNTHVSALAYKNPGWLAASSVGKIFTTASETKTPPVLSGEIYLASTNPNNTPVCRVGHHRSWGKSGKMGYWSEPHVVASPTATRLILGSDWHNSGSVDTYIIELPSYRR